MNTTSNILVLIHHNFGEIETPLEEWMRVGPGLRILLRPYAARDAATGELLPPKVIPLRFRNNRWSRLLIRVGWLENPWVI